MNEIDTSLDGESTSILGKQELQDPRPLNTMLKKKEFNLSSISV